MSKRARSRHMLAGVGMFLCVTAIGCGETSSEPSMPSAETTADSALRFQASEDPSGAVHAVAVDREGVERAWLHWTPQEKVARWHVAGVTYANAESNMIRIPAMTRSSAITLLSTACQKEPSPQDQPYTTCGEFKGCAHFDLPDLQLTCAGCVMVARDCTTAESWQCVSAQ